ncbi:glycosyltransferase [Actinoalloteichus caeruleus]|uniref:Glycosyltransferase, catalytic subunit of cellulose synthase and poly-beta-1,6-N-acetylglucosamine synthase n=1 Tax=Actinoalloteichus caeruleus DSM 43889 TaxID=1120930 RepID=A0ABT1JBB6_ACTCY|nr:glycosyltransferase [Actinoalloteichus caeruleus]MCP2329800.1 Glycosyltransferase, catalytic subunit of cellulose synthase and poly-beta-1,6-N-acetylglucosamine synthase [Actinoalloteichus caeruleus DSM 43889]
MSVIIPNFNYARTLGRCLQAVLGQTYPRVEVLVVDDGSTDGSVAVASRFDCRVIRTPNQGVSAARNTGVAASRGEVLFFLDSDVELASDALATAVELLRREPDVGSVCGIYDSVPLVDDGAVERYKVFHGHLWRRRCAGDVRAAFFSLGAIRRSVFDQVGPLDENLRSTEDVEYGARMAEVSRIVLSPEVLGRHDDDDRLGVLLRKQFTRSVPLVALFARPGGARPSTRDTAYRPVAVGSAALSLASAPLPLFLGWPGAAVPLALFTAFAFCDRALFRAALGHGGARFLAAVVPLHWLMNVTTAAAAGCGVLRWVTSRGFRRRYRPAGERPVSHALREGVAGG